LSYQHTNYQAIDYHAVRNALKNMFKKIFIVCCLGIVFTELYALTGCSQTNVVNNWKPQTQLLNKLSETDPKMVGFVSDVEAFYENLHNKKWAETYEQRNKLFRGDVTEGVYIKLAQDTGKTWSLLNYSVLSIDVQGANKVVLICKFVEGPSRQDTYNSVTWEREDGKWRCDAAGPIELAVFHKLQGN
jgi:hypothetical protein